MSRQIVQGLRLIRPEDTEDLKTLAERLAAPKVAEWLWEDTMRRDPVAAFLFLFANPRNLVVSVGDDDGVAVFHGIYPGFKCTTMGAVWGPTAARQDTLAKTCLAAVMSMFDLIVVEAFVAENNVKSHAAAKRMGFQARGVIPGFMCYSGIPTAATWYELTQKDLALGQEG